MDTHFGQPHSRRTLLKVAGAGTAALTLPTFLIACGDDEETASSSTAASSGNEALKVSAGSDIPKKTVKFGMAPFADATFYVIAMEQGWFEGEDAPDARMQAGDDVGGVGGAAVGFARGRGEDQ